VPNPEAIACHAATLWPTVSSAADEGPAERTPEDPALVGYALEPLLELPGQFQLQFADETLIP
jgi:hypothetical protein